jgi:quinol---cytochrome c reductase iron-sulfur subunit, bacillus type
MNRLSDSQRASSPPDPNPRRSFLASVGALVFGGIATIFPFATGLGVLIDPLRRGRTGQSAESGPGAEPKFVRVGPLDLLPEDGIPRQFAVTEDTVDAWTRVLGDRVGTVFLTRASVDKGLAVTAFSSTCPHLGCAVDFNAAARQFECPCHKSAFAKDGQKLYGPTLRGLDPLTVKLVDANGQQEIWVAYERFRCGVAERIPLA